MFCTCVELEVCVVVMVSRKGQGARGWLIISGWEALKRLALLSKWLETNRTLFCTENHAPSLCFVEKSKVLKMESSLPE